MALSKRKVSTFVTTRLANPVVKFASERGIPLPGLAILETTGRKSGSPAGRRSETAWTGTPSGS